MVVNILYVIALILAVCFGWALGCFTACKLFDTFERWYDNRNKLPPLNQFDGLKKLCNHDKIEQTKKETEEQQQDKTMKHWFVGGEKN